MFMISELPNFSSLVCESQAGKGIAARAETKGATIKHPQIDGGDDRVRTSRPPAVKKRINEKVRTHRGSDLSAGRDQARRYPEKKEKREPILLL